MERDSNYRYPVATFAFYGPDNQFASKLTVGIVLSEAEQGVAHLKKWFAHGTDVRMDAAILGQVKQFLQEQGVQRVVMPDRIIGCPHEEGVDYPHGERCPQCPFWAKRDRWTGEIIE